MIRFGNYLITKDKRPCVICGKLTSRLDYCYELRICSKECQKVIDQRYSDAMDKIERGEINEVFS